MSKEARLINLEEVFESGEKNVFESTGYATVMRKYIDKKGIEHEDPVKFKIKSFSQSKILKDWMEENPEPVPPTIPSLCDDKGRTPAMLNIKGDRKVNEAVQSGLLSTKLIPNLTDEKYKEKMKDYNKKLYGLRLMISLGMGEKFGKDKLDAFDEWLNSLGLSGNQINKMVTDMMGLDSFISPSE